jgi:VWFA-related protein
MNAACLLPLAIALTLPRPVQDPPPTDDPRFEDRVDVERITLDARVLGDRGEPRLGLTARDFRLRIDGRVVPVESAHWVDGATPYAEGLTPSEAASVGAEAAPRGRLLVFFFQKSLERTRAPGLLRMVAEAHGLVDSLNDGDRIAILSFDSHLKLWTDFTGDRAALHAIIERSILFGERPSATSDGAFPSLADAFDDRAARDAGSAEKGLLVLGEALRTLPGAKSLVFFGYGMGRLEGEAGVQMTAAYELASAALLASRTTVFSLDVTNADSHSLEVGLERVAEDTGGFYAKTHQFLPGVMRRLRLALSGHYVLAFERPDLRRGAHRIELDLVDRSADVLAKREYVD